MTESCSKNFTTYCTLLGLCACCCFACCVTGSFKHNNLCLSFSPVTFCCESCCVGGLSIYCTCCIFRCGSDFCIYSYVMLFIICTYSCCCAGLTVFCPYIGNCPCMVLCRDILNILSLSFCPVFIKFCCVCCCSLFSTCGSLGLCRCDCCCCCFNMGSIVSTGSLSFTCPLTVNLCPGVCCFAICMACCTDNKVFVVCLAVCCICFCIFCKVKLTGFTLLVCMVTVSFASSIICIYFFAKLMTESSFKLFLTYCTCLRCCTCCCFACCMCYKSTALITETIIICFRINTIFCQNSAFFICTCCTYFFMCFCAFYMCPSFRPCMIKSINNFCCCCWSCPFFCKCCCVLFFSISSTCCRCCDFGCYICCLCCFCVFTTCYCTSSCCSTCRIVVCPYVGCFRPGMTVCRFCSSKCYSLCFVCIILRGSTASTGHIICCILCTGCCTCKIFDIRNSLIVCMSKKLAVSFFTLCTSCKCSTCCCTAGAVFCYCVITICIFASYNVACAIACCIYKAMVTGCVCILIAVVTYCTCVCCVTLCIASGICYNFFKCTSSFTAIFITSVYTLL